MSTETRLLVDHLDTPIGTIAIVADDEGALHAIGWQKTHDRMDRQLEAYVDPRNVASHRLLLSLAFRLEGLLRGRSVMKGVVVDSNVYGLLRGEFESKAVDR